MHGHDLSTRKRSEQAKERKITLTAALVSLVGAVEVERERLFLLVTLHLGAAWSSAKYIVPKD
jgi:hypothetical protein